MQKNRRFSLDQECVLAISQSFTFSFRLFVNKAFAEVLLNDIIFIGGHQHRPLCRRYPTFDIDISYSDIRTKYVGLNSHVPMSEEFQYRHQLPFRYRTKSIQDIQISKIDQSFLNDPSNFLVLIIFSHWYQTHNLHVRNLASFHCATRVYKYRCRILDTGQKSIPISNIMSDSAHFSPISDIPISSSVRYR